MKFLAGHQCHADASAISRSVQLEHHEQPLDSLATLNTPSFRVMFGFSSVPSPVVSESTRSGR